MCVLMCVCVSDMNGESIHKTLLGRPSFDVFSPGSDNNQYRLLKYLTLHCFDAVN